MFKLNIKKWRIEREYTQGYLAKKVGISQSYLSKLEKLDRKHSPTLREVENIANALEICPHKLITCCKYSDCNECEYKYW